MKIDAAWPQHQFSLSSKFSGEHVKSHYVAVGVGYADTDADGDAARPGKGRLGAALYKISPEETRTGTGAEHKIRTCDIFSFCSTRTNSPSLSPYYSLF